MSETAKLRGIVLPYVQTGNGCDVGSGGDPVVSHCISIELPLDGFIEYNGPERAMWGMVNYRGFAEDLPFKDHTMDWVFSSHLIEDFDLEDWRSILIEWTRVLKPGGRLIILLPDKELWEAAIAAGQPPNCAHKHEGTVGELSEIAASIGLTPIRDERVGDYSILFVGTKTP